MILDRAYYPAHARMGPYDRRFRVTLEQCLDLLQVRRAGSLLSEGDIDIVMDQHYQAHFGGEVQDTIESRILEAGHLPCDLSCHELLVNREFPDPRKYSRENFKYAANMVRRIHISRIESRDHRIEAGLLLCRQRLIRHGDPCVGERVVVER